MTDHLLILAATVLAPGFNGTTAPEWLREALSDGLGGVTLFGHNLESLPQVAGLTAELRSRSDRLLIASDEEGGEVTRIEVHPGSSLPGAAALGAVGDVDLTRRVAEAHGRLLRSVGIDLDLAPVADVNSNPANPVIGVRSFGSDTATVVAQVQAYVEGLQSAGVLACVKHFPGHGDAAVDSHLAVPHLSGDLGALRTRELRPFVAAVGAGVASVMPGHLVIDAVDLLPASISPRWGEILRRDLGFDGLVVTDALDMKAVADTYGVPGACVLALGAGADLLCLGNTREIDDGAMYAACRTAIVEAVGSGSLDRGRLEEAAERGRAAREMCPSTPPAIDSAEIAAAAAALAELGGEAAGRAIGTRAPLAGAPDVLDLRLGMNVASGPIARHFPREIAATWPDAVFLDRAAALPRSGRPLLVLVGQPAAVRDELAAVLAARPEAVIVRTGWPAQDGPTGEHVVFSYGNATANARAVCAALGPAGR